MASKSNKKRPRKKPRVTRKSRRWPVLLVMCLVSVVVVIIVLTLPGKERENPSAGKDGELSSRLKNRPAGPKVNPPPRMEIERYFFGEWRKMEAEDEISKLVESGYYNGNGKKIFEAISKLAACCVQSSDAQDYLAKEGLGSKETKMRAIALIALGATMQDRVVGIISKVLEEDSDFEVRRVAAASLCQQNADGVKKGFVVADLEGSIGIGAPFSPLAWETLAESLMKDKSARVRDTITDLLVLGELPQGGNLGRFITIALGREYPASLRKHIIYQLSGEIDENYEVALAEIAADKHDDLSVRMASLQYLEKTDISGEGLRPLAELLADGAQPMMLRYLGGRLLLKNSKKGADILETFRSIRGDDGRPAVVSSHLAQSDAVEALLWMVGHDPDEREAVKALEALGRIGDAGTAPGIQQAVKMRGVSPVVRQVSQKVIERLQGGAADAGIED